MIKKYKIIFNSRGFTSWYGYYVRNIQKYDNWNDVPTFNTDDHPISEGLKKLEKSGKLDIVNANKEPKNLFKNKIEKSDPLSEDLKVNTKQDVKPLVVDNDDDNDDNNDDNDDNNNNKNDEVGGPGEKNDSKLDNSSNKNNENGTKNEENEEGSSSLSSIKWNKKQIELTEEGLKKLTVKELDNLCKDKKLEGYTALNKGEKIKFVIENKDKIR